MKITETLRWIIGLIITIILALFAVYYPDQQNQKSFGYKFLSYYQTIEKDSLIKNELKISYKEKELENLYSILIEFQNSGNSPIRSGDFESDLSLNFGSTAKVVSASISKTIPDEIPISLNFNDSIISIKPTLLNSQDKFILQIFTTGESKLPTIQSRIAGINKIVENPDIKVEYKKDNFIIWLDGVTGCLLIILSAMFVSFIFFDSLTIKFSRFEILLYFTILFAGGTGLIGNWGEDINFMLPRWINFILIFTFFPLLVFAFNKLKSNK